VSTTTMAYKLAMLQVKSSCIPHPTSVSTVTQCCQSR